MVIEPLARTRRPGSTLSKTLQRTAVAGLCLLGTIGAFAATHLTSSLISNGGNTANTPGRCYKLMAAVGQAAVGNPASGGAYALQGGFLAGNGDLDSIFHQSFEVCT